MHTFHIKSSWQTFYGHLTGNITLKSSGNQTLTTWLPPDNCGNIYITDYDSTIHWNKLQALGRNTSGGQSTLDFHEADLALGLNTADDNLTRLYTGDGGTTPKNITSIRAYKTRINNTPITPSTNNTLFWTGILWDTHDDSNGQYDLSENETLVFVTQENFCKTKILCCRIKLYNNFQYRKLCTQIFVDQKFLVLYPTGNKRKCSR